ncbi:MAG: response regulator transcription factor [Thiolinea sp.]
MSQDLSQTLQILIVDDDLELARSLGEFLETQGHEPDFAYSGKTGLNLLAQNTYHAIVLDVGMPKLSGWEVCRRLREELLLDTPVIFLTGYGELNDKMTGFQAGADDYLVKPFAPEELLLRVQAIVARGPRHDLNQLQVGDITIDLPTQAVQRQSQKVTLSHLEFRLLLLLMRAYPKVLAKQDIITTLWPDEDGDALRTHIYRLRNTLEKPFNSPIIETVYGQGYRFIAHN